MRLALAALALALAACDRQVDTRLADTQAKLDLVTRLFVDAQQDAHLAEARLNASLNTAVPVPAHQVNTRQSFVAVDRAIERAAARCGVSLESVNVGQAENDGRGDYLWVAFDKIERDFDRLAEHGCPAAHMGVGAAKILPWPCYWRGPHQC